MSPFHSLHLSVHAHSHLTSADSVFAPVGAWSRALLLTAAASLTLLIMLVSGMPAFAQSFSTPTSYGVGANPLLGAAADFNGDGKPDLAVPNYVGNDISVLLNNGDGTFQSAVSYLADIRPSAIVAADFNKDGKIDLAVANWAGGDTGAGSISILIGNGNGTFQAAVNYNSVSPALAVGDLNGDTNLDLISASENSNGISVLLGNGNGTFQAPIVYPAGTEPDNAALADFNGDGKLDLAVSNYTGGAASGVLVLIGNGNGTFQAATALSSARSWGIATADLNSDGKQDIVSVGDAGFTVFLGNGSGTFQAPVTYAAGENPSAPVIADFNGDGKPDVAVGNYFTALVRVFRGNGDGTLQAGFTFPAKPNPTSLIVSDLNIDGKPDLVVSSPGTGRVNVLLNSPSPHSVPISAAAGAPATVVVASFIDYDTSKTACSFTATINWGDGSASSEGSIVANGSGGFNILGTHTYAASGIYMPSIQLADDANNIASVSSTATVVPANGKLLSVTGGSGQSTPVNNAFSTQLQVTYTESGVPVSGVLVTFSAPVCGASGKFAGSGTPTESVLTDGSGLATASMFTANSTGGTYAVQATIAGGSPAATLPLTNTKLDQTIAFGSLSAKTFGDPDFTVSASATSGLAVSFGASGNCTGSGNTVHITAAGSCTITASQSGNATYNAAADVPQSFTIAKANQTITFGTLPSKTFGDADFNVSATANSGLAVSFGASGNCTVTGNTVHITAAGSCTITASQAGNTNYNGAPDVPQSFSIAKANQTISFGALPNKNFGDADFTVSATAISGLVVSFIASGSCTISGNNVHLTGGGSCTITASQSGDSNYNGATNLPQTFTIAKATSSTAVTSSVNPSDFSETVTFTTTVTSTAGTPGGTVQFKNNGVNMGAAVSLTGGVAQFSISSLPTGTRTITADYSGSADFLASTGTLTGGQVIRSQPTLSINDVSTAEGDSGTKLFTFTVTLGTASHLTVTANYATLPGTADFNDFVPTSDLLTFDPGQITKTIAVTINGDTNFEPNEQFTVKLTGSTNSNIIKANGTGTILNDDAQGGFISFSQPNYTVSESGGSINITVNRTNDVSRAATVNYATSDTGAPANCGTSNGLASSHCDFTTAAGTLSFAAGETQKTFPVLIGRDSYAEGTEMFTVNLSNPGGGAVLATPFATSVSVTDDNGGLPANSIDDGSIFVRMHYHDFLNREADQSGLNFWTGQMTNCGNSDLTVCRVNVSGAFFLSIEFQQTGYLVERVYKTAYADATGTSTIGGSHQIFVPVVRANEFLADTQRVGRGVVVGQTGWETVLENNKQAYALEFVQTSRFVSAFPTTMTSAAFVSALNQNAGNVLSPTEFNNALAAFGPPPAGGSSNNVTARAQVLRQIAEDTDLYNAEFNRAFVLTEYIGYLRRNPNDAPDSDYTGYDFWLGKLNQFNGDYIAAEMVKAFISSSEYRQRFGP